MSRFVPSAAALLAALAAVACGGHGNNGSGGDAGGGNNLTTADYLPVASFTATASTVRPQVFHLDASASYAVNGSLATYVWTFGDGSSAPDGGAAFTLTSPTTLHAYAASGSYTITLVVTDDSGNVSKPVNQQVSVPSVNTSLPVAVISGPNAGSPGQTLSFSGSGSTPMADIQSYVWAFGDPTSGAANSATGVSASHAFAAPGPYDVTLTVQDSLGQSDTAEDVVTIGTSSGPVAVCTFTPASPVEGAAVTFSGASSTDGTPGATIATWAWDFGDGTTGSGETATHSYNTPATFNATLQVIDSANAASAKAPCPPITVGAPSLCNGSYSISANPDSQDCGLAGPTTFETQEVTIVQADGGMTLTEQGPDGGIVYSGTYSGSTFNLSGSYGQSDGVGGTVTSDDTLSGSFTGCQSLTISWTEDDSDSILGSLCTLTWNVTGSKI